MSPTDSPLRRIGVDTGGTFTDCVYVDYESHEVRVAKVPSRPSEPHTAILDGVGALALPAGTRVESLSHGTTIATNAVITGDLARVGLITTRGFRDVLEIGTQQRPSLYNLQQARRPALVPRHLRLEVGGRIAADGAEIEPLDPAEVEEAATALLEEGVEAVAIGCLFSYVNADHEEAIQDIVRQQAPELYVGRSSRISQEPREYPRFATAAVNAALAPRIDPYVRALEAELEGNGLGARLYVMQSNGGIGTTDRSVGADVHQLILSGPAAGVIGGGQAAADCGFASCVTFDVGGTSADVGVVRDGSPRTAFEMTLPNGVPCKLPHIEIDTIGAGGGSIGWTDGGGALHVGPQSAGAEPGPACYGRGGVEPTVTDAHLRLGRLAPTGLIGGELALDPELADAALDRLARRLGTTTDAAAIGILAVLEENMAGEIRQAAARHGDDLRDFVLVAGGGAGPLHAASIMRSLGMPATIVPPRPGLLSALGLLSAHLRHDLALPVLGLAGSVSEVEVEGAFANLRRSVDEALAEDGVEPAARGFEYALELRYAGQDSTLRIATEPGELLEDVVARFHGDHERTYGHSAPDVATEVVSARIVGLGLRAVPEIATELPETPGEPYEYRAVAFGLAGERVSTPVFRRAELARGQVVKGPAILEQLDTTTVVLPGMRAQAHDSGALIVADEEATS